MYSKSLALIISDIWCMEVYKSVMYVCIAFRHAFYGVVRAYWKARPIQRIRSNKSNGLVSPQRP